MIPLPSFKSYEYETLISYELLDNKPVKLPSFNQLLELTTDPFLRSSTLSIDEIPSTSFKFTL